MDPSLKRTSPGSGVGRKSTFPSMAAHHCCPKYTTPEGGRSAPAAASAERRGATRVMSPSHAPEDGMAYTGGARAVCHARQRISPRTLRQLLQVGRSGGRRAAAAPAGALTRRWGLPTRAAAGPGAGCRPGPHRGYRLRALAIARCKRRVSSGQGGRRALPGEYP